MDATQVVLINPDFLALGLGGTNMMAMLWTVAMGRQAVGVEMRGDPFLGVHWNIREVFYHQLGLLDTMIAERYGEARVPRRKNGKPFRLAECFYSRQTTAGDIVADEIIDGYDTEQHIVGTIQHIEFIDDRWRDGLPNRVITLVEPPTAPERPDPNRIRTSMVEVLDGPSMFQAEAASIQKLLRRYLELMERQDRENNHTPRVQLFTHHRVVLANDDGFIREADGRLRVRIEALQEFDFKGQFVRTRVPGSEVIDLGVPDLIMIAEGFSSADAKRLGFEQHDVKVDHADGRGEVVAQADFLAGLLDVLVDGRLRRRISSEFDQDGKEYWVRQIAVGHENDPEVGWVLIQVPDFKAFDPIEAGLVPAGTEQTSPEFFAAYQHMIYDFYMEQCADILEVPKEELMQVQMIYGPTLFSLVERVGADPLLAANGVVAGDSFGNGHFLTSGGAMTGMIGHGSRILEYWQSRDAGNPPADALRQLADRIRADTHDWLQVSAKEYSQAIPINFGVERIERVSKASGIDLEARANAIDAVRRQRHELIPLDPSNWRRLFVHNGKVLSELPELAAVHPQQRAAPPAPLGVPPRPVTPVPGLANPRTRAGIGGYSAEVDRTLLASGRGPEHAPTTDGQALLRTVLSAPTRPSNQDTNVGERTVLMPWPRSAKDRSGQGEGDGEPGVPAADAARESRAGEQTLSIRRLNPTQARVYLCLDIDQNEQIRQRIASTEDSVVVGRADSEHGIVPTIDLTSFDPKRSVSRQHARIYLEHGAFIIEDLGSRHHTQVGATTLTPHQPTSLQDGDVVTFGTVRATVRFLGTSELPAPWPQA